MIMQAVVIEVQWERLLVLDLDTRQQVLVNTPNARWFVPGNLVLIWYNGVMTRSIPPQIFAQRILPLPGDAGFPPAPQPPIGCPPGGCVRPPAIFPPFLPPILRPIVPRPPLPPPPPPRPPRPPAGRPPSGPPGGRPPDGRPPDGRPGGRPPRDRR